MKMTHTFHNENSSILRSARLKDFIHFRGVYKTVV